MATGGGSGITRGEQKFECKQYEGAKIECKHFEFSKRRCLGGGGKISVPWNLKSLSKGQWSYGPT